MIPTAQRAAFREKLLRWYRQNGRDLPWRHTRNPYAILVSEFMLQQTQVSTVIPFYTRWLSRFPTFDALAAAPENEVLHAWQGLGYYGRARNLHSTAKLMTKHYGGTLPACPDVLIKLPGLGRYTANAVATFAFERPVPIVEANITRVVSRLFNIHVEVDSAAGRDLVWKCAASVVPKTSPARFNSALMDLGALICVRRNPKCSSCPVKTHCRASNPALLPIKKPRPKVLRLTESHGFCLKRKKILLEQSTNRWRGMWILPSVALQSRSRRQLVHTSVFPFTHHRVTLQVFDLGRPSRFTPQTRNRITRWVRITALDSIPIPSPHRRAINAILRN